MKCCESIAEPPRTEGKFLTFALGRELYGVNVLQVREIIRLAEITLVPQMPNYVRGVINLRGKIVPVIDLRMRFNLRNTATSERTCIIVAQLPGKSPIGLIVDSVQDVVNLSSTDIEEPPDFGSAVDTRCLAGLAKNKGKVISLLELENVLSDER